MDNYTHAFPLLKKYHIKATIFLNTFFIGENRQSTQYPEYLTWQEIREMQDSGLVEFQLHTHQHNPVFKNAQITGFIRNLAHISFIDALAYPSPVETGFPMFKKRGAYSLQAMQPSVAILQKFKHFFHTELEFLPQKEALQKAQAFIDEHIDEFTIETQAQAKKRIQADIQLNQKLIAENTGKTANFFAWTWGHKSKMGLDTLKASGIQGVFSTKKGSNWRKKINFNKIRRIELRNFTVQKFKLNLFINQHIFLGKMYELFT
jgi:hypothetical protein